MSLKDRQQPHQAMVLPALMFTRTSTQKSVSKKMNTLGLGDLFDPGGLQSGQAKRSRRLLLHFFSKT
jgi:hypothetical protein